MDAAVLWFYRWAAGALFLRGAVAPTGRTVIVTSPGPSWYNPGNVLPLVNLRPETCSHNSKPAGLCITWSECVNDGHGIPTDIICPNKKTICCVFHEYKCNKLTRGNTMHITSPSYPTPFYDLGYSELILIKRTPIQLLRIDFIDFRMAPPNVDTGICETDRMIITNGPNVHRVICGLFSNQHIYYRVDDNVDTVKIKFITTALNYTRTWKIKITQWTTQLVPASCTQYFINPSGTVQTTNYTVNGRQLMNQDFKICIKRRQNACWIIFEPCYDETFKIFQSIPAMDKYITPIVKRFQFGPRDRQENPYGTMSRCIRYEQQLCN